MKITIINDKVGKWTDDDDKDLREKELIKVHYFVENSIDKVCVIDNFTVFKDDQIAQCNVCGYQCDWLVN